MNKKKLKARAAFVDSKTIAALKSAVEDLVSRRKQPNELEGIIAEAKALAREWKNPQSGRPLIDETLNTNILLAALVVALTPYYESLEPILSYAPNEFENASLVARMRFSDEVRPALLAYLAALKPTGKQKPKDKRRSWRRNSYNSIEYQFSGATETKSWKSLTANLSLLDLGILPVHQAPRPLSSTLPSEPACLDDIFAGETVNMQKLEDLFGTYRHRLLAILQGSHKPPYNYLDVVKIMDALLSEKPRKRPKKSTAGRPARPRWLNDVDLRTCVLSGIQARIKGIADLLQTEEADLSKLIDREFALGVTVFKHFRNYTEWEKEIASRFLFVVRQHLPDAGKK